VLIEKGGRSEPDSDSQGVLRGGWRRRPPRGLPPLSARRRLPPLPSTASGSIPSGCPLTSPLRSQTDGLSVQNFTRRGGADSGSGRGWGGGRASAGSRSINLHPQLLACITSYLSTLSFLFLWFSLISSTMMSYCTENAYLRRITCSNFYTLYSAAARPRYRTLWYVIKLQLKVQS
jgi:hypothetical protein